MAKRKTYLTSQDAERLGEWFRVVGRRYQIDRGNLQTLQEELQHAKIVEPDQIPRDVVTLRSEVRLIDEQTGQEMQVTLVFPEDAIAAFERVSVLAPLGAAILGCRAGDVVRFQVPLGWRTVRIAEVIYQPEAAGHFNL